MRFIKLQYLDTVTCYVQPHWNIAGRLYLDYDDQFKLSLSREIQQLTDINKINIETALGTSLPGTEKNLALLGIDINYNLLDVPVKEHKVLVDLGFHTLRHDAIKVLGYSKKTNRIEIEIIDGADNWITKIKSVFLDDLPFQSFEYNKSYMLDNMTYNAAYVLGEEGYYLGLVNYGRTIRPAEFTEGDFRPLVHSAKIYELLSNLIGVKIVFPLLETEVGSRIVNYLLKENFNADQATLDSLKFKAVMSVRHQLTVISTWETIKFGYELEDIGDNYDPVISEFTGAGVFDFTVILQLDFDFEYPGSSGRDYIEIQLVNIHFDGYEEILEERRFDNGRPPPRTVLEQLTWIVKDVLVNPGDRVYVRWGRSRNNIKRSYITSGTFMNTPISFVIQPGDIFNVQKALRHDLVLDMIKGDVHFFNLKILEERHTNTIHFLTPYDADYFGDVVSGYMTNITKSFLEIQVQQEEVIKTPVLVTKNVLYKFKDSTDAKITEKKLEKWEQPFVKFIDNGFDREKETDEKTNPYFEPTINGDAQLAEAIGLGKSVLDAPFMVDNLEKKSSYKIAPRKLIAYGRSTQINNVKQSDGVLVPITTVIYLLGQATSLIPNCFQYPNVATEMSGVFPNHTLIKPDWKLVYGDSSDDNYQMFYKRWVREFENRHVSKLKIISTNELYFTEYFRKRIEVLGIDGNSNGRFISISGYNPETGFADYEFIPDNQSTDDCDNYVEENKCKNYPQIIITKDGTEYTFSQGGTIASPITSTKFEYKYRDDPGDFIEGSELGNPIDVFLVRMTLVYSDGCETDVIIKQVDPCGNKPKICFDLVDSCLTISECGTHNSDIDYILIEYSETIEEPYTYKTYNGCIDVTLLSSVVKFIHARITVNYLGGCLQKVVKDDFQLSILKEEDCPTFDDVIDPPSVIGVTTANGFELIRTGSYNCCMFDDFIEYRKKGSRDTWKRWIDGLTATQQPFVLLPNQDYEARRKVSWCGKGCEPWCGQVVYVMRGCAGTTNITDVITSCINTLKWRNPDTGLNHWKVNILNDQTFHVPELQTYIERNCGGVITEEQVKRILWDRHNFRTQYQITWQPGHKVENMEIHQNIAGTLSGTITIPVNVIYNTGDDNDTLELALINSVESYLSTNYSATNGVHYDFIVEILGTGTNRTLKLIWWAKDVFTSTWYGAKAPDDLVYMRDTLDVQTTVASTKLEIQKEITTAPKSINYTECGAELRVQFSTDLNKFLDDDLSNFDTMTPLGSVSIDDDIETSITDTCNKHVLTAVFTCASTDTYLWKEGEDILSEDNTITVSGPGRKIDLYSTCNDGTKSCTFKKSIVLT